MFNNYEEYDNIDNEVYDVYNLYAKSIVSPKKQEQEPPSVSKPIPPKPIPQNQESPKKVKFSEKVELFPGNPPEYDIFRSCGDNCKLKENRVMYEGFCKDPATDSQQYSVPSRTERIHHFYNSIPLSGFEIIMIFILIVFIVYIKQRLDAIEMTMYFLSMHYNNIK